MCQRYPPPGEGWAPAAALLRLIPPRPLARLPPMQPSKTQGKKPVSPKREKASPPRLSLAEAMRELEKAGSAQTRKTYARHGAAEPMFGVSFATLKALTKRIDVDHELALALWATGNFDARNLAVKIVDPARMYADRPRPLGARGVRVADVRRLRGHARRRGPTRRGEGRRVARVEGRRRARFRLDAARSGRPCARRPTADAGFEKRLAEIERTIHAAPNAEREAMNMAVICIGCRSAGLRKAALATAKRIGKVEVDHGDTACKTPDAAEYIEQVVDALGRQGLPVAGRPGADARGAKKALLSAPVPRVRRHGHQGRRARVLRAGRRDAGRAGADGLPRRAPGHRAMDAGEVGAEAAEPGPVTENEKGAPRSSPAWRSGRRRGRGLTSARLLGNLRDMSRRDPYRKRLQNLVNSEALKTLEKIRSTRETPEEIRSTRETPEEIEEIRSFIADHAPGGRVEKFMKLYESLDSEERTLLTLRVDKAMPWEEVAEVMRADGEAATPAALRERFERLKEKLGRLAREQGLIE